MGQARQAERKLKPYEDPKHRGNSAKYHTGKRCIEDGCEEAAGTWWSPYWCFKHNAERMHRITGQFEEIRQRFEDRLAKS